MLTILAYQFSPRLALSFWPTGPFPCAAIPVLWGDTSLTPVTLSIRIDIQNSKVNDLTSCFNRHQHDENTGKDKRKQKMFDRGLLFLSRSYEQQ